MALVLLGTAWDYQDHPAEFLARLEELAARGIAVRNPPEVVRWNADKSYLQELAERGATTVPALYREDAGADDVAEAMERLGTRDVVVKRQVGAGGLGQHRFTADSPPSPGWRMGHRCLIQPFLPSVVEEGEYTFVFVDGEFSHGVRKRPAKDDYRIQSLYGGLESAYTPSVTDLAGAKAVLDALPFADLLYARIDMIRLPDGALAVMEAELIEPYLYPEQGPELGARLAPAIADRLA
ncbi:RimK family alpha-L-glutamate ligase [Qipengyuania sp. MTN3-11]|uniref:ATP-grasp domain-containing protein n=1 Tax=Qipengyuania sp. MTN3-11 TaxID=3056557 RepID=UPI0036F279C0